MHTTFALTVALAIGALSTLFIQEKQERFTHPMPADGAQAGMARWVATMKPGPAHERLKELLGDYEVTMRVFAGGPDSKPTETKGTAKISWFAEGKWLKHEWTVDFFGKTQNGLALMGYDNFKQRYVTTTIDSLQTCMNTAFGHFDMSGDDLILWGTIDEPMTPEQDKMVKYVYRGFGKDKWTFEVHDMMIGESNTRVIAIEYTRKKQ